MAKFKIKSTDKKDNSHPYIKIKLREKMIEYEENIVCVFFYFPRLLKRLFSIIYVKYLIDKNLLQKILFPNNQYSSLYRKIQPQYWLNLSLKDVRKKFEYK